jgi:hypothetical protein
MGGFIVTIPIRLILYISYITPIISPPQHPPCPIKAIVRGFFGLFHIAIWSPSTIYPHLNLFHSPSPLCPLWEVNFGLFNPFHHSFTSHPHPPFFNSFQCTSLYPLPLQILRFMLLLMLYHSLSFSSFPEFHRAVPLLQTCSTSEFVYDVCFCVYVYLLDLSSTHERKQAAFVFLSLAYFTYFT